MRILNWVQNKLKRGHEKKKDDTRSGLDLRKSMPDARRDEVGDWTHELLAIGTFGIEMKQDDPTESSDSAQDLPNLPPEEVIKLQRELTRLFSCKTKSSTNGPGKEGDGANLSLTRCLNFHPELAVDRTACMKLCSDMGDGEEENLSPISKIILHKARDLLADNRAIRRRSALLLLKNMFVCRSGFGPTPSLRDPIPESRIEKLLRAILHKKIYPQNSTVRSAKRYLKRKQAGKKCAENDDEIQDKGENGCRWVKTDSEYIVLEI